MGKISGAKFICRYASNFYDMYLSAESEYPPECFRRRFKIPLTLFINFKKNFLYFYSEYWSTRMDGFGRMVLRSEVKLLDFLRLIGTRRSLDDMDDFAQREKETFRVSFPGFWRYIKNIYKETYLNKKN